MAPSRMFCAVCLLVVMLITDASATDPAGRALLDQAASVQGGYSDNSYPSPSGSCPGKVSTVFCKEDDYGRLRDIAYSNTQSGLHLVGCARGDWTDDATQVLQLDKGENIIEVKTCKPNARAKLAVTFITDYGREMTCGEGSDYRPYNTRDASDSGEEDSAEGAGAQTASTRGGRRTRRQDRGRQLLAPGRSNAAKIQGTRYNSKCVAHVAPKEPVWTAVPYWWKLNGAVDSVGRVGEGKGSYFKYEDGRYFKDWDTYSQEWAAHLAAPNNFAYTPYDYYTQVWPLAAFDAQCDRKMFIKQLNSFCWNDNGEQPPGPNAVTISIDLGEGTPCPSTAAEFAQLDGDLFTVSGRLLKASVNVVTVLFEPVEGGSCVPGLGAGSERRLMQAANTTVTASAGFVPGPGSTLAEAISWLQANVPDLGNGLRDLCDVQLNDVSICEGTSIYALEFILAAAAQVGRRLLQAMVGV